MQFYSLLNQALDLGYGTADDADSRKVRDIGSKGRWALFDHNEVMHEAYFSPACFRMLFSVPFGTSSEERPATVTRPALM